MPTPEVIIIGTSSPAFKEPPETIVIGSDLPTTPIAEQINTEKEATEESRRFSEIFNQFRAKWNNQKSSVTECATYEAVGECLQEETIPRVVLEPQPAMAVKATTRKRKGQPSSAKPRTKNEAVSDIECVIDERIDLNLLGLPNNLKVSRQRLPFDPFHGVVWREKEEGKALPWIVCIYYCDMNLIDSSKSVLDQLLLLTSSYPRKAIVLAGWRDFVSDYDKQMQRGFQRALKDNGRFSGSAFVNLEAWRRTFFLDCLARKIVLVEADLNGSFGRAIERWITEASKAIAWAPHRQLQDGLVGFCTEQKKRKVGKNGQDLFRRMLQCVPRMSPSIVDAIIGKYPDLRTLVQGLTNGGPHTLSNIQVNSQRTIGPVLSEKLHFLFTKSELGNKKIN